VTLPALLLMERFPGANPVTEFITGRDREGNIARAIEMIKSTGLIQESYRHAEHYSQQAVAMLDGLPPSACRDGLKALAVYLVRRRN
jgi:geranylgeranyl pyrophosphate synthase